MLVFTAGVGENGPEFREMVLDRLKPIGICIDNTANNKIARFLEFREGKISSSDSKVEVCVLPTDEEAMIVKDTYKLINE